MPRVVEFDFRNGQASDPRSELPAELPGEGRGAWVHLEDREGEAARAALERLGIEHDHSALIRDPGTLPGLFEGEDGVTLVLEYWNPLEESPSRPRRFFLHLRQNLVITGGDRVPALDRLDLDWRRQFRFARTPGFILFLVLDYLLDDFVALLSPLDEACEELDDRVHSSRGDGVNRAILAFRRQALDLKRIATNVREVLIRLSGRKIPVISDECRESLMAVTQHAQVVVASLEGLRDRIASTQDSYRAELAQRLNETMKVLTVFSVILMPMTLIAGIYGMNFEHMPETRWSSGYFFALFLMVVTGLVFAVYFKRKGLI